MDSKNAVPGTLIDAVNHFSNPDVCIEFLAKLRWPDGVVVCPNCSGNSVMFLSNRRIWKCRSCKKQFSIKVGTIFEDSPIPLQKWLPTLWMLSNCKNGVSSYEIHRAIGVTQKTAWFMLQRIRLAMQSEPDRMLGGEGSKIEADETFIGGKARNMHINKRRKVITARGPKDKTAVMGIIERDGEVRAFVVPNRKKKELQAHIREHVQAGSAIFTDELLSYVGLEGAYAHEVVNHAVEYVRGEVHTNTMENFWSLLKRGLHGTYISVEPFHLFRYLDEQMFRYNEREHEDGDAGRFVRVASQIVGKRLTYERLIGNDPGAETCTEPS